MDEKAVIFLGSDIYASSITLAAFMGGLALGGYFASCFADRIRNHKLIIYYGILEIIIGVYALAFGKLLGFFDPLMAFAYTSLFESFPLIYQFIRSSIAFILLIIPTIMMGATLPIILKAFTPQTTKFGEISGHFYAINTFGALLGVFSAGFILIPMLGLNNTTLIAVGVNICIGFMCMFFSQMKNFQEAFSTNFIQSSNFANSESAKKVPDIQLNWKKAVFIAIGISGFGGLALEVIWIRILIQSFSATVYSFSLMLVTFLFGIALGSKIIAPRIGSSEKATGLLVKIEIAIAFSVAILAILSFVIPTLFGILVWGITALSPKLFGVASILGALIICAIFMLPSAMLLGAAFPIALKAYNLDFASTGKDSGSIVFINTIGAVTGALITGFILIPIIGSRNSLLILSVMFFLNGLYVQQCISNKPILALKSFASSGGILIMFVTIAAFIPNQIVLNYNLQKDTQPNIVYHSEDISGVVNVIKNPNNKVILSIDGNIEADNSLTQRRHFVLKAHLPLMLSLDSQEVLIVGLGLGITTSSVLKHPNVKRVDVIELLPSVVKAQEYLKDVNADVLSNLKLDLRIDDGRNFLKFTENKYDVITADPIHPRVSGVGVLYTKKYYSLIFEKLKDNGVVLQWMPLYSISEKSFEIAVRTMAKVFSNTSVWYVPGHILLLGAKTGKPVFDYKILRTKFMDFDIASDLKSIGINSILDLLRLQLMSPAQLQVFLNYKSSNDVINTEDFPYLEYNTPFEYLTSAEKNLNALLPYSNNDEKLVINAPSKFLEKLKLAQELYRASFLNNANPRS